VAYKENSVLKKKRMGTDKSSMPPWWVISVYEGMMAAATLFQQSGQPVCR